MTGKFELDLTAGATPAKRAKVGQVKQVALDEQSLPEVLPASEQLEAQSVAKDEMPSDRDLVNQLLGQIQMANSFARFADVVSLQKLKYIKDNKIYRSVAGLQMVSAVSGEKIADVGTWDGFCKALGLSVSKVDEDLLNLNTFGEEALKQLSSIGAGYRELRQYRKLPTDEKNALIEAAKAGDKDQLLDLAESLIEKHISEKAVLSQKTDALVDMLASADRRMNNMNAEIERTTAQLERLKNKQRVTRFEDLTETVRDECMHLQAGCSLHLDSLQALFERCLNETGSPEYALRIEQIYVALNVVASHALHLVEQMRERAEDVGLPDRIQGQHILLPEEAERWLHDAPLLASKHEAEKLSREISRENAKEGKRGRKLGSSNKAKA